jgi:hypothetical protein
MSTKYKNNPAVPHFQPDLFRPGGSAVGEFVPLEDLTEAKIRELPRSAFSQEEFDSLDDDLQEAIHYEDSDSRFRIDSMVNSIGGRLWWSDEGDSDGANDEFSEALGERSDSELLNTVPDEEDTIETLYYTYVPMVPKRRVQEVLLEHLRDPDYYEKDQEDAQSSSYDYPFKISIPREFYIGKYDIDGLENAYPDEIRAALDKLDLHERNYVLGEAEFDEEALMKLKNSEYGEFTASLDPSYALVFTPKWEDIIEWVEDELKEEMPDKPLPSDDPRSYSERKIYTFEDGAYWVELTTEDLPGESEALGHCVGQLEHGYPQAVRDKELKIFSLRTPGGRSKLTAAFFIDEDGAVTGVREISGTGNRRPGWAAGKTGEGKVKWMEVQKVGKLLELLGIDPGDPDSAGGSLLSAHMAMTKLEDPKARKLTQNPDDVHCGFCCSVWGGIPE